MSKEKQNVLEKTLKDVHEELVYKDQMGQKTTVKRSNIGGERSKIFNLALRDIGQQMKENNEYLKPFDYLGSIAVHYYRTEATKATAFVSQTGSLGKTPEIIVQDGITDLRNACLEVFGHRTQNKRSGF